MLKITIEATELIIDYGNILKELEGTFERVIERCKGLTLDKGKKDKRIIIVSGEPQHLYACLFNLAIIFDIELW